MKVNTTHILENDLQTVSKNQSRKQDRFQKAVIKGKVRDKGDELRGFNTHLIGSSRKRGKRKR